MKHKFYDMSKTLLFRSYNSLFNTSNMTSNTETSGYDSDDFM